MWMRIKIGIADLKAVNFLPGGFHSGDGGQNFQHRLADQAIGKFG